MTKHEFLLVLRKCLAGLPKDEIEQQVNYYSEMIDDRIEEGLTEEEAINQIGDLEEIVDQPPRPKEPKKPKFKPWEIVLLAVGSPIWASLLIAAFAVAISVYAVLWSGIVSLWAGFASLVACSFGGLSGGIIFACTGSVLSGVWLIGAALVCAGLSIFMFFGCKYAALGMAWLTKNGVLWLIKPFRKKEEA